MTYADEDEIDWSDGSFDTPPQKPIDATARSIQPSPHAKIPSSQDSLVVSDIDDQHRTPCHLPLEPVSVNGNSTVQGSPRVHRARTGVHLNRRLPSKEDYMNYAIYQASQKAYEATFLNTFITHALHPERIAQCSENPTGDRPTIAGYLNSVSHEVNDITRKMIWNAHCRTVHLLARDGEDGAPFLDVHAFDAKSFSSYGPSNLFPVAQRVKVSWHRASPNPVMVRYSTKEYNLGYQAGPLEELDDFTSTVFRNKKSIGALPIGRAVRSPTSKKRKGQNMPGAATREKRTTIPRSNWLPFVPLDSVSGSHVSYPIASTPVSIVHQAIIDGVHQESVASISPEHAHNRLSSSPPPHLGKLFSRCDAEASNSDHAMQSLAYVKRVHPWRTRLINDHKQRLTRKWDKPSQAIDCVVRNFEQAVVAAISIGIRPTADGCQKRIKAITARERHREYVKRCDQFQDKDGSLSTEGATLRPRVSHTRLTDPTTALSESISDQLAPTGLPRMASLTCPRKKRKRKAVVVERAAAISSIEHNTTAPKSRERLVTQSNGKTSSARKSSSSRLNESKTLEPHQHLPPNAYFEPFSKDEKFVWRCAFKHAMGHYYNAGDRKCCRGCNTSLSDNTRVILMDFYMPPRTFYFQPAQDAPWKPSKQPSRRRKSDRPCHNAVAKDAYWEAINAGASEAEAQQIGIDAVVEYSKPKPPPKAPTPEPTLKPEPKPDLGPHPSGSATVEHGQDIPDGYYWKKQKTDEEHAWRCDINHGLGRYYLAGDRKTCPGCGSSQNGPGKHKEMDFYLPSGTVVRQQAPGLSKYKPRKPYKLSKSTATKREIVTHNQMCSNVYFELIDEGYEAEEATRLAVERVDSELDNKQESKLKRQDEQDGGEGLEAARKTSASSGVSRKNSANTGKAGRKGTRYRRNSRGGCTMALVPRKRSANDLSEEEMDEIAANQETGDTPSEQDPRVSREVLSTEEDSSASESE